MTFISLVPRSVLKRFGFFGFRFSFEFEFGFRFQPGDVLRADGKYFSVHLMSNLR